MAFEIVIPRLGWSMEEGTFSGWLKKEGDFVRAGEALFSLEGEKAIQDIESIDEGILRIPPNGPAVGTVVKVGAVVGYLTAQGEALPWLTTSATKLSAVPNATASHSTTTQNSPATKVGALPHSVPEPSKLATSSNNPIASPSVRRFAREVGVDLAHITGTGPRGRITTQDVLRTQRTEVTSKSPSPNPMPENVKPALVIANRRVIASPRARRVARELNVDWKSLIGTGAHGRVRERDVLASRMQTTAFGIREPLTARRRTIAERLTASRQQTVPVTMSTKADASKLIEFREQLKATKGTSPVPSYQDMLMKMVATLLIRHRRLASRWDGDGIVLPRDHEMNIGMAVDTEDGLLVPVVNDVNSLSLGALAEKTRSLIERARAGKLPASQMQNGVFTLTNLGAFGIDVFTPVINLPESAILGLGAIRMEPTATPDGQILAKPQLSLSLTFDHRVIDGAPAARFLQDLVASITEPAVNLESC